MTLEMNGEVFKSGGQTVIDALNGFGLDYTQVKTKGVLTLEKGKLKSSKLYYLPHLRRIICNKLRKVQVAKDLEFLLK